MTAAQWAAAGRAKPPARRGTSIGLFLLIIVIIGLGTAALVQVLTPPPEAPPCVDGRACSGPPAAPSNLPVGDTGSAPPPRVPVTGPDTAPALTTGSTWLSRDLAFSLEYEPQLWAVADEDGGATLLRGQRGSLRNASLLVEGASLASGAPEQALQRRVDALSESIVGLAEDTDLAARILGANIGYVDGVGAVYGGATDTPQGPRSRARVAVLAASDGHLVLTATLVLVGGDDDDWDGVRQAADSVLNTVLWASAAADERAGAGSGGRHPPRRSRAGPGAPETAGAVDLGPAEPERTIELTLALLPRDPDGLARYTAAIVDPSSPDYGRVLTPSAIGDRFGPEPSSMAHLAEGLERAGLTVVGGAPQRTTLRVSGPIRAVEALFATRLERYRDPDGRTYLAPLVTPQVPAALRRHGRRRPRPRRAPAHPAGLRLAATDGHAARSGRGGSPVRPASGRRRLRVRPAATPEGRPGRQRPDDRDRLVRRDRRRDDRRLRPGDRDSAARR